MADPELPKLRNDCFALPAGVDWVPVDAALEGLRSGLSVVVGTEIVAARDSIGRVLARDQKARRANPPRANSAVDGFGFSFSAIGSGTQKLPLVNDTAAAGSDAGAPVPHGSAIRILTGAALPEGVDTVVMEEDTIHDAEGISFRGSIRKGANTRAAGEDIGVGAIALQTGHRMRASDVALLAAVGIGRIEVYRRLRVGVLSTGDELRDVGDATDTDIPDANRPMLLGIVDGWGHAAIDLGIAADKRDALRQTLDRFAATCDAILTSGGASAGDEDHLSALMNAEGSVSTWRIALKPGRPMLLGLWKSVPVFGLPGNPVAAFTCTVIFARPALGLLAGAPWQLPRGQILPAGFSKQKKAGRREYLRARRNDNGSVDVYHSEGSGRISGISWADGLVELEDGARVIEPGDPVRYISFSEFGV